MEFSALATAYNDLKPKFHPFCIGHPACHNPKAKDALENYNAPSAAARIKQSISDIGGYIVKGVRSDRASTSDTHLYRVRKAEKIRKYIAENGLQAHFVVPEKFILRTIPGSYVVLAEKLTLTNEVAPVTPEEETEWRKIYKESQEAVAAAAAAAEKAEAAAKKAEEEGNPLKAEKQRAQAQAFNTEAQQNRVVPQIEACLNGALRRALTMEQVRGLAHMAFLHGYTDQSYGNFYFTPQGQVAILDTEPVHRAFKKLVHQNLFNKCLFLYTQAVSIQRCFGALCLLKYRCNAEQIAEVEKIEKHYYYKSIAQSIVTVALCCLAIYAIPQLIAGKGFPYTATALKAALWFKTVIHILQTLGIRYCYIKSKQRDVNFFVRAIKNWRM